MQVFSHTKNCIVFQLSFFTVPPERYFMKLICFVSLRIIILDTADFIKKKVLSVYSHSMATIYLSLIAQVAKSTFLLQSPLYCILHQREIKCQLLNIHILFENMTSYFSRCRAMNLKRKSNLIWWNLQVEFGDDKRPISDMSFICKKPGVLHKKFFFCLRFF